MTPIDVLEQQPTQFSLHSTELLAVTT